MRAPSASRIDREQDVEFAAACRARLVVVKGPSAGRELVLEGARVLVGRDPQADLALSDDSLSRHHALLLRTAQGYQLQDLESANGTWVNGVRTEIALLEPGDRIAVGEHLLHYLVGPRD